MKKAVALVLTVVLLFSYASAEDWGSLFGGLSSLFSSEDEITYGVGEEAVVDDLTIKLINVMNSKGNSYYTPDKGMEYIILEFEIANNSKEDVSLSTMLNFTFWCDDTVYIIDLEALATAMLSSKYQLDCIVEAGKKVTGVIGYEIPTDWELLKTEFKEDIYFGESVTFLVEKE